MTLNDLKPGARCTLVDIVAEGALAQRLMDLGFFPGVNIEVVRNAPLIDPIELYLDGYHISVRQSEAKSIVVME